MTRQTARNITSATILVGLTGGLLLGPVLPVHATARDSESCTVTAAELRWGVKESFRNYISGSIANGEWTIENGASYETPAFVWANGAGGVGSKLESGTVKFTGDVHFTGHSGLMKLDIRDPELVFTGSETATLVLHIGASDTGDDSALSYEPVAAATVNLGGYSSEFGSTLAIPSAHVVLTEAGAAALNNDYGDYVAGADVDPIGLTMTLSGCELAPSTGAQPTPSEEELAPEVPQDVATPVPWALIAVGGIAIVAIGVTGGMLLAGRKKQVHNDGDVEERGPLA